MLDGAFTKVVPSWDKRMMRVVVSKVLQALMKTWGDDAGSQHRGGVLKSLLTQHTHRRNLVDDTM